MGGALPMTAVAGTFDPVLLLIGGGVLAASGMLAYAIYMATNSEAKRVRRRLEQARSRAAAGTAGPQATASLRLDTSDSSIESLDRLMKKIMPRPMLMRRRLAKTGRRISLGDYALINLVLAALVFVVVDLILGQSAIIAVPAAVTVGFGLPHMVVGMMIARRQRKFTLLFPEAIELIVRGLKSGLPVSESFQTIAAEIPEPVGSEFARIADSLKMGKTLEEALWEIARRLDIPEFNFFVISLSVQKETGGNLAETLENLADILRRRKQMKLKVRALSAEARASAYILGALPFLMFGILSSVNPDYTLSLINDPRGELMLGAALVSMILGAGVMFKMARFEI